MHFIWPIFFNSANIKYLLSLMCVICSNGNEVVANSGYTNVCFSINSLLKMLPRHFLYFHCSNLIMTFDKDFMKKSYHFLTSSRFLLYRKILRSGNCWQLNDYRKYHLNNFQNLQTNVFLSAFVCKM